MSQTLEAATDSITVAPVSASAGGHLWGIGIVVGNIQTFSGRSTRPAGEASKLFDEDSSEDEE